MRLLNKYFLDFILSQLVFQVLEEETKTIIKCTQSNIKKEDESSSISLSFSLPLINKMFLRERERKRILYCYLAFLHICEKRYKLSSLNYLFKNICRANSLEGGSTPSRAGDK